MLASAMTCRSCGAQIAEKAIVCYRCGTATAIPDMAPRPSPPRASRSRMVLPVLILVEMAAAVVVVIGLGYQDSTVAWVIAAVAAIVSVVVTARVLR